MSDTPRTDEQINGKPCTRFEVLAGDSLRNASVPSFFARQLERELNVANDRIKRLEEALDTLTCVIGLTPIKGNLAALQQAFDMARAVLNAKEAKP